MATRILPRRGKARVRRRKIAETIAGPPLVAVMESALRDLHRDLDLIVSVVILTEHALIEQNTDLDKDAGRILRVYVGDPLYQHTLNIEALLEKVAP